MSQWSRLNKTGFWTRVLRPGSRQSGTAMGVLLLLLVSLALLQQSLAQSDPCGNYTQIFDEFRRSADFVTPTGELQLCDNALSTRWYRFEGGAGGDLVDVAKCQLRHCGTTFPVCLKDFTEADFPTTQEGEVTRTACRKGPTRCGKEWPISVKNCGSYRVYRLTPTDACPSAYCVGEGLQCPPGQCSETGFTPCSSSCPHDVTLSPTVVADQEMVDGYGALVFRCSFTPPQGRLLYNVYWYVNDKPVASFTALPSNRVGLDGRLQEKDWEHIGLGMVVKCSLRARLSDTLPPAQHFYSQPFFAGLELEHREITVREGNSGSVRVRSTVPTPVFFDGGGQTGTLFVYGFTPRDQSLPDFGLSEVVFGFSKCSVGIPNTKWHDWHEMKVSAGVDGRYQNSRISLLRLGVDSDLSDPNHVWTNMTLPDVKVVITDEDRQLSGHQCISHNDPHMTTFNSRPYENQNEGEFILYKHAIYPVSVHVKYENCKLLWRATCNCAIAMRAYDSLMVVDRCRGSQHATVSVNHISYTNCNDRYLLIERDGNTYTVRLPTGTQVKFSIGQDFLNGVNVIPSPADIGQTRGLCGQLHPGTPNMDLVLRDGTATNDVTRFIQDWQVKSSESLFIENPVLVLQTPVLPYCFCSNNNPTKSQNAMNCSLPFPVKQEKQSFSPDLKAFLHSCGGRARRDPRTSDYVSDGPSGWGGEALHSRKKRSVPPEWRDGWTEERARHHCREAFQRSPGLALMEEATGFSALKQAMLDSCVLDVKYTADTYFTNLTVEVFKGIGKAEVEKNVTLLETEVGRTLVAEIAKASCPLDCSGHGTCDQGECQCDQGYKGVDCSVDTSLPPDTPYIPQGGLCNTRERACQSTPVLAGNLPETGAVFCGFRPFQIRVDGVHYGSQRSVTVAEPWTQGQVQCPFPRHVVRRQTQGDVMAEGYNVSLSNNNVTYSTEVVVVIYDAGCMTCSADDLTCNATGPCSSTTTGSSTTPTSTPATWTTTAVTTPSSDSTSPVSSGPCSSYYLVQDEYQRSVAYVTPSGQAHLCDQKLTTGWFRFQSGAGRELQPLSNCSVGSCGTVYPVCVKDGEIPTVAEGEVNRTVCMLGEGGVCRDEWPIRIQNCGGYRVYYLTPTPSCPSAYCVGTEVPCPPGQCSSNGFTPGCKACPTTTTTPVRPGDRETGRDNSSEGTVLSEKAIIALSVCFAFVGAGVGAAAVVALYFKLHNAAMVNVFPAMPKAPLSTRPTV